MTVSAGKTLSLKEDQLEQFGHHLHSPEMEARVFDNLRSLTGGKPFQFMDVGGGIGTFSDRVLEEFPHAKGIVLDNAETLLRKNVPHPRKTTLLASVESLQEHIKPGTLDVVFVNLMLHHLVGGGYAHSLRNIRGTLQALSAVLRPGGAMSVIEQTYEGLLWHNLPSHIIYHLTASRVIAAITRRLGANTAGIGVCFQSEESWKNKFSEVDGMRIADCFSVFDPGLSNHPALIRLALHIRTTNRTLFWMVKEP